MLLSKETRVLVQGITGKEGLRATVAMRASGTQVVCGVTPGKGGQYADGLPVYHTVAEALQAHPEVNASILYVPPAFAKDAACEAIGAGIPLVVIVTERIPVFDTAIILAHARLAGVRVIGPSSIGILVPGIGRLGMIGGARPDAFYRPGPIAVLSRSGGMTNELAVQLSRQGIGISVALSVGGDYLSGTTFADLLPMLESDPQTRGVVLFDEMGGTMHHEVLRAVETGAIKKPIAVFVGGRFASQMPDGMPIGHAGSFIEGGKGTVEEKMTAYQAAGVNVADRYDALPQVIAQACGLTLEPQNISAPMIEPQWKTALTNDRADGGGRLRGYALTELMGRRSFAEVAWLLLRGELPTSAQARLFEAILVAGSDHGVAVPSVVAARTAASGGATLPAAVAAGLLAVGPHHGGAIEAAMQVLAAGEAQDIVRQALEKKERLPGFGHRLYTSEDPRATRLLQLAKELAMAGPASLRATQVAAALAEAKGKMLPLNIDGAIAALLLDLGFPPAAGNGIFVIARTVGLTAHVLEERMREQPFRRTPEELTYYDGPAERELPRIEKKTLKD